MADPIVKQWFSFVDKDNNGSVSIYEMQNALSQGGLHFSLQTVASLMRMYDPSGTGAVDFASFERMHNFIVQTQDNFKVIDRNGDGKLSRAEVETALEQAASGMFEGYAKGTSSINLTFDQFVYAASHCR